MLLFVFYWYLKKDNANITNINADTDTVIFTEHINDNFQTN